MKELITFIYLDEKDVIVCSSHRRAGSFLPPTDRLDEGRTPTFDFATAIPSQSFEQSNHNEGRIFSLVALANAMDLFITQLWQAWLWLSRIRPCLVWCRLFRRCRAVVASFFSSAVPLFDRFEHHWDLHSLPLLEWTYAWVSLPRE